MAINTNGHLWIFCLNVGQADTTVVATPQGNLTIVDAVKPDKLCALLSNLGLAENDTIDHLVVTHPHYDHYSAVQRLLNDYTIGHITLSSLWRWDEDKPGYNNIVNLIDDLQVPVTFLAGYTQCYPDDTFLRDPDAPCLELLGPSNQLIEALQEAKKLNTNHRSLMTRLQWQGFIMLIAGDAQMENWAHFDAEQMLDSPCSVLRAAHHGSPRGTQYERLERLAAEYVIVSSDPESDDHLPDLVGCACFHKYALQSSAPVVALTDSTGTIKIDVAANGSYTVHRYGDDTYGNVNFLAPVPLDRAHNPTDWPDLLDSRI
jgi:competence protein ComEC